MRTGRDVPPECADRSLLPQVCRQRRAQLRAVKRHADLRGSRPMALLRPCANRSAPTGITNGSAPTVLHQRASPTVLRQPSCTNGHVLVGPKLMCCPMQRCCARSGGLFAGCPRCCRPGTVPSARPVPSMPVLSMPAPFTARHNAGLRHIFQSLALPGHGCSGQRPL